MQSWEYSIILPFGTLGPVAVDRALKLAAAQDWELRFPAPGVRHDGLDAPAWTSRDAVVHEFGDTGGTLALWCADDDVELSWSPVEGLLSFCTLCDIPETRSSKARALETLFIALCTEFSPEYGYSSDDYLLFKFEPRPEIVWTAHLRSVAARATPLLLLWLNFFSTAYFSEKVQPHLATLVHRAVPCGNGTLVYLARSPWEAGVAQFDGREYRIVFR